MRQVGETVLSLKRRIFDSGFLQRFVNQLNQEVREIAKAKAEEEDETLKISSIVNNAAGYFKSVLNKIF